MADLSLDDYISKKPMSSSFNKNRLGPKISPGRANVNITSKSTGGRVQPTPLFNVVGMGRLNQFDARSKITHRKGKQPQIHDARQKLTPKIIDARVRIQNRVGVKRAAPRITAPGAGARITAPGTEPHNARIKLDQTGSVDARQLIQSRQNKPIMGGGVQGGLLGGGGDTSQSVTVTGLGRVIGPNGDVSQLHSHTVFTPKQYNQQQHDFPVTKTIGNSTFQIANSSFEPVLSLGSNRVGNNIVITPDDTYRRPVTTPQYGDYGPQAQVPQQALYQKSVDYTQQLSDMPLIQIHNDAYREPDAAPVPTQPVYLQPTYYQPPPPQPLPPPLQPVQPSIQPVQLSLHPVQPPLQPVQPPLQLVQPPLQPPVMSVPQHDHMADAIVSHLMHRPASPKSMKSRLGGDPSQESVSTLDYSPLQGYRVLITNLHKVVTQADIVELFGVVGALKKVKMLRLGSAEVVFVKRDEAMAAIRKYNNRELDGQPMHVVLGSSGTPAPNDVTSLSSEVSRIQKAGTSVPANTEVNVDISLLHKALFKTMSKDETPARPVTFTVKI